MMLEVNDQERDLLRSLLEAARSETSTGIHHAMDYKTRESLRAEREMLKHMLEQLGETAHAER